MKQKNKELRLKARQVDYEKVMLKFPTMVAGQYHKPGSMKK